MTNGYRERRIFLSDSHTNNGLFFLLTTVFLNKFSEVHEYAKMQFHMMTSFNITMTSFDDHMREFQYNQCMKPSRDSLGKIAWVRYEFLSQEKISDILIRCASIIFLSSDILS